MATFISSFRIACVAALVLSGRGSARIPKVYNALITSNQNLEPSKAIPVYQPVIQESAYGFPYQPSLFYGGDYQEVYQVPLGGPPAPKAPETSKGNLPNPPELESSSRRTADDVIPSIIPDIPEENKETSTSSPPPPPSTVSPIPLNEFGLPAAVFPLGRLNPIYNGYTQVSPFYTYPGLRFYNPYDTYNFNPYHQLPPFYQPSINIPRTGLPLLPQEPSATSSPSPDSVPTLEPNDLNIFNHPTKDPVIPNVPPPPLPEGAPKDDDKSE